MSKRQKTSEKNNTWLRHIINFVSLLITGSGIGWLVGLSVSPVISIVITSVVGSAAAIVAAVSGLANNQPSDDNDDKLNGLRNATPNPVPIATLVIGLVIGSWFGVQARTHDWLEPDIASEIEKWKSLKIPREKILQVLFEREFSISAVQSGKAETSAVSPDGGFLFAMSSDECDNLLGLTGKELKTELAYTAAYPHLRELPEIVENVDVLEKLLESVLCPDP